MTIQWAQDQIDKVLAFFDRRRRNYQMVFSKGNPADMQVLADLAEYCFLTKTTFVKGDPDLTKLNEGKRQAGLYIFRALNFTPEDQFNLATIKDKP